MPTKKETSGVQAVRNATGKWVVKKFDQNTLVGVVALGAKSFKFHSTSFQSDTGFRFPRQGEHVEIVMTSSGNLLSVHGK